MSIGIVSSSDRCVRATNHDDSFEWETRSITMEDPCRLVSLCSSAPSSFHYSSNEGWGVSSRKIAWYVNFLLVEVMKTTTWTRNWIFEIALVDLVRHVNVCSTQQRLMLFFIIVLRWTNGEADWWSYRNRRSSIRALVYYRLSSDDKNTRRHSIELQSRVNNIKNHLVVLGTASFSLSPCLFRFTLSSHHHHRRRLVEDHN